MQESQGLVNINADGHAILRVETTAQVSGNRQSVRLQQPTSFNGGLVILDAVHMPTGCGIWPAFWTNGPNWPYTGEIDIVEGTYCVNLQDLSVAHRQFKAFTMLQITRPRSTPALAAPYLTVFYQVCLDRYSVPTVTSFMEQMRVAARGPLRRILSGHHLIPMVEVFMPVRIQLKPRFYHVLTLCSDVGRRRRIRLLFPPWFHPGRHHRQQPSARQLGEAHCVLACIQL